MALITWDQSSITMQAGATATVRFYYGKEYEYLGTMSTTDTGVATIVTQPVPGNDFAGDAVITAVSGGTVTTTCRSYDTQSAPLTITVESAEDESYLNKRGLTHFWENIDTLKQDKLTAGNYSTSEQDTKFTWTNGAKIYKKTIVSTNLVAGENNINHGISNLGLVLKYDGFMDIGGGTTLPIPTMASATNNSVSVWIVNSTIIRIFSSLAFTGKAYITLYYTKTS